MPPLLTNDFLPQRISSLSEWFSPWTTSVLPWWLVSHQWMISKLDELSPSLMNAVSSLDEMSPPLMNCLLLYVLQPDLFNGLLPPLMTGLLAPPPTSINGLLPPPYLDKWSHPSFSKWPPLSMNNSSSHMKMLLEVYDQEMRIKTSGG